MLLGLDHTRRGPDRPARSGVSAGVVRADRRDRGRQVDPARCARAGAGAAGRAGPGARRRRARRRSSPNLPSGPTIRPRALLSRGRARRRPRDALVVRRVLGADGRSRAFVDDEPASVGLLRELGDSLVEIQGQFEQRGLLDPANHRAILDAFAEDIGEPAALAAGLGRVARRRDAREAAAARLAAQSRDEEDLAAPSPRRTRRARTGNRRRGEARRSPDLVAERRALGRDPRRGDRRARRRGAGRGRRSPAPPAGWSAPATAPRACSIRRSPRPNARPPRPPRRWPRSKPPRAASNSTRARSESVEERLFALRALARKHQVAVADLPALRDRLIDRLAAIEAGADGSPNSSPAPPPRPAADSSRRRRRSRRRAKPRRPASMPG